MQGFQEIKLVRVNYKTSLYILFLFVHLQYKNGLYWSIVTKKADLKVY